MNDYTYLGKKRDTGDHVPAEPDFKDRACLAQARGAIGDCIRVKGHTGFHQGAHFESWTDETTHEHDESTMAYRATIAAPGHGQVWDCTVCGKELVRMGQVWIDPDEEPEDEEPSWVLDPEDVR